MSEIRCYIGAGEQCRNCGLPEPMHTLPHQQCPISDLASVRAMADAGIRWAIDALARRGDDRG